MNILNIYISFIIHTIRNTIIFCIEKIYHILKVTIYLCRLIIGVSLTFILLISVGLFSRILSLFKYNNDIDRFPILIINIVHFTMTKIIGIKLEVIGREHLVKNSNFIIASEHKSFLDIYIINRSLNMSPIYIMRKEIKNIPLMGQFIKNDINQLLIDRSNPVLSISNLPIRCKNILEKNQSKPLIIFPEGSRKKSVFKAGIFYIHQKNPYIPVIPVSIDTELFSIKRLFIRPPHKVTVKFTKALPSGLEKKDFMEKLKNQINQS